MERKDRLFLVVLDAHVLDAGVVLLVDVLEHVCRLLGAVDQLLELRWNRVGEVGGRVIRVVAELAVLGVGIVFLDHGLALRVGDLAGVCRYRNAACVAEEVLHIIGEDVVDELGGQILVVRLLRNHQQVACAADCVVGFRHDGRVCT